MLLALVKLADIDSRAKTIDDRLKGIPAELEERRAGIRKLEDLVHAQRASLAQAEKLLSSQESDLSSRNDGLSKAKAKGAKAKSMKEVEAAERELEAVRRSIRDGEVERDGLRERIERTRSSLVEPEKALEEARAELATQSAEAEVKLAELRQEREGVVQGREEWTKRIDKQVLRTYTRLAPQRTPVVIEVKGESCGGCRMALSPQRMIQIQKATELLQCQSCQRFLYHKSLLED